MPLLILELGRNAQTAGNSPGPQAFIGKKKLLGQVQAEIQVQGVGGVLHIQLPGRRIQQSRV